MKGPILYPYLVKILTSISPKRVRYRLARFLFDYLSPNRKETFVFTSYLEKQYHLKILINLKDIIGWNIFFWGEYEKETNDILKKIVNKNDVIIEAGANIGSETILLSRLASQGHIYAFEPSLHVYGQLQFNIQENECFKNTTVIGKAIGEADKTVTFSITPKTHPNQGLSGKYLQQTNSVNYEVEQITLDSFVINHKISKIDLIKMDIQGAEYDLLTGGETEIKKHLPLIYTEASDSFGDFSKVYYKLVEWGYEIYRLNHNRLAQVQTYTPNVKHENWLAIHSAKKKDFQYLIN